MSVFFTSVHRSGLLACAGLAGLLLPSPEAFAQAPPPSPRRSRTAPPRRSRPRPRSTTSARLRSPPAPRARRFPRRSATSVRLSSPSKAAPSYRRRPIRCPISRAAACGRAASAARPTSARRRIPSAFRPRAAPSSIPRPPTATINRPRPSRARRSAADIARLNYNGWNLHLGTTAGYLGSRTTDNAGFGNEFEVPFFGTYFVATNGRFFADLMVRKEFYNINLNNPALAFTNQPVGAQGYSISASTGYNFDLGEGWFIEPSAGFIYSKTSVDSFTAPGVAGANFTGITGVIQTDDVTSQIGRASLARRQGHRDAKRDLAAVCFGKRVPRVRRRCQVELHVPQRRRSRRSLYIQPEQRRHPASAPMASIRSASPGRS